MSFKANGQVEAGALLEELTGNEEAMTLVPLDEEVKALVVEVELVRIVEAAGLVVQPLRTSAVKVKAKAILFWVICQSFFLKYPQQNRPQLAAPLRKPCLKAAQVGAKSS